MKKKRKISYIDQQAADVFGIIKKTDVYKKAKGTVEIWKKVDGYAKEYEVSNYGRVRENRKPYQVYKYGDYYVLPSRKNREGFRVVDIKARNDHQWDNYRTVLVHEIVAKAFLRPITGMEYIIHKNHIPYDNRPENLAWSSVPETKVKR